MQHNYCRSDVLSSAGLQALMDRITGNKRLVEDPYYKLKTPVSIMIATEQLEPLRVFSLNPSVGVRCGFNIPYEDGDYTRVFDMVRNLAGRTESVRAHVRYKTQVETSQGIADLSYNSDIMHNGIAEESESGQESKSFIAAVGYLSQAEGIERHVCKEAIRNEFFRILSVTGLDKEVSLQEEEGEFRVLSRGPYTFEREPIDPSCLSITNIESFEEAMAFQAKVLNALPLRKTNLDFYCAMTIEDYEWFRVEYAGLVRPWRIDCYGRLHDWVKPLAPVEELPPDAPKEVPIIQSWDSNLKLFTMGRILRTPVGLRLLIYTNRTDAKKLAKRMKDATGVKFEPVEYGASF